MRIIIHSLIHIRIAVRIIGHMTHYWKHFGSHSGVRNTLLDVWNAELCEILRHFRKIFPTTSKKSQWGNSHIQDMVKAMREF